MAKKRLPNLGLTIDTTSPQYAQALQAVTKTGQDMRKRLDLFWRVLQADPAKARRWFRKDEVLRRELAILRAAAKFESLIEEVLNDS